ncbi:hypothetical protein [Cutibacterium sp. V947]|uniref:hypothetical protein n=1 Tax=unclassified Cutibacterium TaxID=2649671 RepID=UPI003EDF3D29
MDADSSSDHPSLGVPVKLTAKPTCSAICTRKKDAIDTKSSAVTTTVDPQGEVSSLDIVPGNAAYRVALSHGSSANGHKEQIWKPQDSDSSEFKAAASTWKLAPLIAWGVVLLVNRDARILLAGRAPVVNGGRVIHHRRRTRLRLTSVGGMGRTATEGSRRRVGLHGSTYRHPGGG